MLILIAKHLLEMEVSAARLFTSGYLRKVSPRDVLRSLLSANLPSGD